MSAYDLIDVERATAREWAIYLAEDDLLNAIDAENKAKDKADEELDSKRVHNGMRLEEFLVQL